MAKRTASKANLIKHKPKRRRSSIKTPIVISDSDSESAHSNESEDHIEIISSPTSESTPAAAPQTSLEPPLVSSTLFSTVAKWAAKANSDDQNTRKVLSQLAKVIPREGPSLSSIRNDAFESAKAEALVGLRGNESTTRPKVKRKGKGKVAVLTFKVSSIIFIPCGTRKGPPSNVTQAEEDGDLTEDDYIDIMEESTAPTESTIQLLEQQQLAIRNLNNGYELNSTWDYNDICRFLQPYFPFLFRYFKEGPNAGTYSSLNTPFIVVHKRYQTLTAVPVELNGDALRRNSDAPKSGLQMRKLFFVTRDLIPGSVLSSWRKGNFTTAPSMTSTLLTETTSDKKAAKRKRTPSISLSDENSRERPRGRSRSSCHRVRKRRLARSSSTRFKFDPYTDVTESDTTEKMDVSPASDDTEEWETYDPSKYDDDSKDNATAASGAGPSGSTISSALVPGSNASAATSAVVNNQASVREATPIFDEIELVTSHLLSPSQRSFSDLNLYSHDYENPYGTEVDLGLDF